MRNAARPKPHPAAPSDLYIDARQAAGLLKVSLPTLYTYVTRKNIRTRRLPGSRESWYLRSDVELLKEGRSGPPHRQSTPGLTMTTAITLLSDGHAYYRGQKAVDLAASATLEEVACLLWQSSEVDPFSGPWPTPHPSWKASWKAMQCFDEMIDRMMVMLPAMEAANQRAHDLSKPSFLRSGADLLLQATAIEIGQGVRATVPVHAYMGEVTDCGEAFEEAIRTVLVLSADLAMEPATYAVRAAANPGATPYQCVAAGLAAASGKRLPSTRTTSFARFIGEIETAGTPTDPITSRMRENEPLPGFGFSPFTTTDSRSVFLWQTLRKLLAGDRRFERFDSALRLGQELTGLQPEFALLGTYVSQRIGRQHKPDLIRIGRLVGWIAHALEQQTESPLIRWRVNYKGALPA